MNFKDCLQKGYIRRDLSAKERVDKSLEISSRFLGSAKKNLDIEEFEMSEIASYNSIISFCKIIAFQYGIC